MRETSFNKKKYFKIVYIFLEYYLINIENNAFFRAKKKKLGIFEIKISLVFNNIIIGRNLITSLLWSVGILIKIKQFFIVIALTL